MFCSVIRCPAYPLVKNAMKSTEETTFMTSLTIKCMVGYEIDGHKNITVVCQEDREWSQHVDQCLRKTLPENS